MIILECGWSKDDRRCLRLACKKDGPCAGFMLNYPDDKGDGKRMKTGRANAKLDATLARVDAALNEDE